MIETSVNHEPHSVKGQQREPKRCGKCGETAGSISAGTGRPLVGLKNDRDGSGPAYHLSCHPRFGSGTLTFAGLERMGG